MGENLFVQGQIALRDAHGLILLGGLLGVCSILAGLVSRRIGAPTLLVFLVLGMLAGADGLIGIPVHDFRAAYLVGSVALAIILFEGGVKMPLARLRTVFWPALLLATVGVALTAGVLGACIALLFGVSLPAAILVGAAAAPTDAAAVNTLLRRAGVALPPRLPALLEAESGFNDPMSIFLTALLLHIIVSPQNLSVGGAVLLFTREMAGGAVLGVVGGWLLAFALRVLRLDHAVAGVFVVTGALSLFALAQLLGTSGFLATYIAALIVGATRYQAADSVERFLESLSWLAQIVLFLMLGLLVTPHDLPRFIPVAVTGAIVLIFLARPIAVMPFLLPLGFTWRESVFASWVGLRGAVPIYLSFLPAVVDPSRDEAFFAVIFVLVVTSLVIQGWTVGLAGRILGFGPRPEGLSLSPRADAV